MSRSLFSVTNGPFTGGGIFTALQALDPPWSDEGIAAQLDLIYYGNVSGSKLVSPLVERILTGSKLSAMETATLAGALMATNGARWSREWATRSAQYDPIENYHMVEEMTDDETVTEYGRRDTRTDNLQHGETRTDNLAHTETRTDNLQHSETRTDNLAHTETRTDNLAHSETRTDNLSHRKTGTETLTPDVTVTENNDVYGFNSSSAVHDTKRTQSSDGTSTTTYNITETDTGTVGTQGSDTGTQSTQGSNTGTVGTQGSDTGTVGVSGSDTGTQSTQGTDTGTQTNVASGSDTSTRNYQLTRSGNIGVTTSQQMLQSERDLWMWNFFYDVVFPDVDTVLTIPIYAETDDSDTPGAIVPTGTIAIIANGDYDVARYAAANVNVPNTYTVADENKVVSGGQLVSQTAGFITSNGTHNTMLIGSVDVNVPNSYTAADEGKAVRNGALVEQGTMVIENATGTIDTTYIKSVSLQIKSIMANYDFTAESGLNDITGHGFACQLSGDAALETGTGVVISGSSGKITTPNYFLPGISISITMGDMARKGSNHGRFVMWSADSGLIWNSSAYWGIYAGSGWINTGITNQNIFAYGKTTIAIDAAGYWRIYREDTTPELLWTSPSPITACFAKQILIGSSSASFYDCEVRSLEISV